MNAREFEERVATALRKRGWVIIHSFDGAGANLIACVPDGTRACVQCSYGDSCVTDYAVLLSVQAKKFYDCPIAVVVTTGEYTGLARTAAYENEVRLMRFIEETGNLEYAQELSWLIPW